MKGKCFIAAIACSLALFANAAQVDKPEVCPSVLSIKQVGFQHIQQVGGLWYAWSQSQFDTHHKWLFGLFVMDAYNESDAMKSAIKTLDSLNLEDAEPEFDNGTWGCVYDSGETFGAALTPPPPEDVALKLLKLRQHRSF